MTKLLTIRLSDALFSKLEEKTRETGATKAGYIRVLLKRDLGFTDESAGGVKSRDETRSPSQTQDSDFGSTEPQVK